MDILHRTAKAIWECITSFPIELTAFFTRCAIILLLCIFFGHGVKNLALRGLSYTLPLQIGAFAAALLIGLAIPLQGIGNMNPDGRNLLFILSFLGTVLLPYAAVSFMVRWQGYQRIAWKMVYLVEGLLFLIQIIALSFR